MADICGYQPVSFVNITWSRTAIANDARVDCSRLDPQRGGMHDGFRNTDSSTLVPAIANASIDGPSCTAVEIEARPAQPRRPVTLTGKTWRMTELADGAITVVTVDSLARILPKLG